MTSWSTLKVMNNLRKDLLSTKRDFLTEETQSPILKTPESKEIPMKLLICRVKEWPKEEILLQASNKKNIPKNILLSKPEDKMLWFLKMKMMNKLSLNKEEKKSPWLRILRSNT